MPKFPTKYYLTLSLAIITMALNSCQQQDKYILSYLPASQTNVHFSNDIMEDDSVNILEYHYLYNGGGVGIGDFNNDGKEDLVFTGNQVPSAIYLNEGDFKFKDVTEASNFQTKGWATGVSVVDINADGWLDIYISVGGKYCEGNCVNQFFIHQGLDENGIPKFKEQAKEYGIADGFYTQQAAFFDYDNDGDLDVYLLRNVINMKDKNTPSPKRYIHPSSQDALFRNDKNDGKIIFTDVSKELGINQRGYGLGIAINDFNQDGWADIYIANDFLSPDLMYLNKGNSENTHQGFKEVSDKVVGHTTYNSMGVVATDVNNDALPDIYTVDMLPNYQERQKTMVGFMNYQKFMMAQEQGYTAQFMRNTLQVHNGMLGDSVLQMSEVGYYSGIYNTDWSWAPVFADFDNDGDKDLYVTNGYVKDITDLDFINYNNHNKARLMEMLDNMKGIKINNFLYENQGDLAFQDQSSTWIATKNSYSNGAATVDLDNDGDLDMVVNNLNDKAFIIKNNTTSKNYIQIKLSGTDQNPQAIGSQVTIWHNGQIQKQYVNAMRGYLSSALTSIHFGLGNEAKIDSLHIEWMNGQIHKEYQIKTNQVLTFKIEAAKENNLVSSPLNTIFTDITKQTFNYQHQENPHYDYNNQRLLLRQYSRQGPCIIAANIDGKVGDELFIGGARNQNSKILFEQENGSFITKELDDKATEAVNALFIDVDNDKDLDLYVVNGGSEVRFGADYYQDVLYVNDGNGNFKLQSDALPEMKTSTSKAVALDFDQDGDQDIFVSGYITPHQYPTIPRSYLLENDNGIFKDITPKEMQYIGMVTDVLAVDYNKDTWHDLILVGEWLPLTIFQNNKGTFKAAHSISNTNGFWNCIAAGDFDQDGDMDFIGGNLGLNTRLTASNDEPLVLFTGDLDENGSQDPLIGQYYKNQKGDRQLYAMHARDDVTQQLPVVKTKWIKYIDFGKADFETLLEQPLSSDNSKAIYQLASVYFENDGNGNFITKELPRLAQWSAIQDIQIHDFDKDGRLDALLVGNDYTAESNGGWHDASTGVFLKGDGNGGFIAISSATSGFYSNGDNRDITILNNINNQLTIWVGRNSGRLKVFGFNGGR
jgi:hypothetical protein